jgi:predicted enzyme involved in methoxymalonyl-ACP biosynthesis
MGNKAREINSPVIKQLLDETNPEELAKIDAEMTNNKQQTAVQDFWNNISLKLSFEQIDEFVPLFYQAKEMEKEQIKETASVYYHENTKLTPTQYYNETYGDDKQ